MNDSKPGDLEKDRRERLFVVRIARIEPILLRVVARPMFEPL
ncbi:MAG TPA: hypothetical protein VK208_22080 [Pyrinomonadaceae bacterium]|jgi:hypothetical protein|nr:hypothetical protein [Pyrinomonadaceae bacterium]